MARTKAQLLLRRLKRAKWKNGRLRLGAYRIDLLPDGKWYLCVDAKPIERGRFSSTAAGKRSGVRALRRKIREEYATA